MGRRARTGGRHRTHGHEHRLAPGESPTRRKSADEETANEVAEKADACPDCDTVLDPEDVHIVVDNALWEFYPVGICSDCGMQFEPGFGWS